MLDRASTFADPRVVNFIKTRTIPVAIDQWYHRRRKDAEGEFFRKIARGGPRHDFENGTAQGLYLAGPDGTFLGYTNHRDPKRVLKMLDEAVNRYTPDATQTIKRGKPDPRFHAELPKGGLIVRARAKVLGGYSKPGSKHREIFQNAISRDNLWIRKDEHLALVHGRFPKSLAMRMARFNLVDNTRGEPPRWQSNEIRHLDIDLSDGVVSGKVKLRTASGNRTYDAALYGHVEVQDGRVVRFDLVAKGLFSGEGRYTPRAPKGRFPLAVAFELADGKDLADAVIPQGTKDGRYLR